MKAQSIKKRLKIISDEDEAKLARLEMHELKSKSRAEVAEDAFRFLELDDPEKIDAKKKGV